MRQITSFLFFVFLGLTGGFTTLNANHIIGGELTYECLGGNTYRFKLNMYRDCFCTDCAELDPKAYIGVYRCSSSNDCSSLNQADELFSLEVNRDALPENVPSPDYPCLIPPNICVETASYTFTLTLPPHTESYHVTYQRCCRNTTINNIPNPDDYGATYTVEILPELQDSCNSSPVFNDFPPTVICAGQPLVFDHSASDPDGDQLVYEFCAPLQGGGQEQQPPAVAQCIGVQPNPACPPPYFGIPFLAPDFTPLNPMGGDPIVTIDPNTGIITGTPMIQGQYVVGVCVREFRNGVEIGRILRDFQFNVARCDPTVEAVIAYDELLGEQEFLVNSCGENTVFFDNQSFQENFISEWFWEFEINGQRDTFSEWSPTITFPDTGFYAGHLYLNPNTTSNCEDTARIFVNVFPEIRADFEFAYDTCVAGPTQFTNLSESDAGPIIRNSWSFGDGNTSPAVNPAHVYQIPGTMSVQLEVEDMNGCTDVATIPINYFPIPGLIVIAPSDFTGCTPATIFFNNLSFPIDSTYDITWTFGDGGVSSDISPTHVYEEPGVYSVDVNITSPIGCATDTSFSGLIAILESPVAGFSFSPDEPSNIFPEVRFFDESQRANRWSWDFGGLGTSIAPSPTWTFRDTGFYEVTQIVTHPNGCQDTLVQLLDVRPEIRYFLPNAFTPNGDGDNDGFRGVGIMEGVKDFRFTIWNRWGELLFETNDPFTAWNGQKNNTGKMSPNGVYVVAVQYREPRGELREVKGLVTLIK